VTTAVMSVYKVASFPDGGGHFWVYLQLRVGAPPPGVRRLLARAAAPCARSRAADLRDLDLPGADAAVRVRGPDAALHPGRRSTLHRLHVGRGRGRAAAGGRAAELPLRHRSAATRCARRTALVDIDPGLLQFWMSSGQLKVPPHDSYLTTARLWARPLLASSDCGLRWTHLRPPVCLDLWPVTYDARSEAFTTVSTGPRPAG